METKNSTLKNTRSFHIDWKPPVNMDLSYLNQIQVEYAFNTFFQQHPEILEQIFQNLDNDTKNPPKTILPEISQKKRDAILLSLMEELDDDCDDLDVDEIKSSRLDKNYPSYFFDEQ
jgi:hypothetical protein